MENEVSISIARTPFQLFNCIEAVREFNSYGINILICIYKDDEDKILFNKILEIYNWKEVYFFKLNFFNRIFYSYVLNNYVKKYINCKYCFFGLITSYNIHLINKVNAKYNVLIDDGNEIFLIINNIKNDKFKEKFKSSIINWILRRNLDLDFINKLEIFSFFDIDVNLIKNKIIRNNYLQFKKSIKNLEETDIIFFIGSNLINTYISREYFENLIKSVIEYFNNYEIIYIPHRYENFEYLNKLSEKYNFKLKKFSTILELGIMEYGKKPSHIISIRSTALETLASLYDIKYKDIIGIDLDQLIKKHQVIEFENLYNNYRNKGIDIIKVIND